MLWAQTNNLAPDTIDKTDMDGKGWYTRILDVNCIFVGTLVRAVRDAASVYGLNGLVEIAADSKA
jgi:hypothetical protein